MITTQEQLHSAFKAGVPMSQLLKSPYSLRVIEERQELVRLATPLYKELHSSVPFYADRPNDDPFWAAYIGSRVVAARELVARHQSLTASSTPAMEPKAAAVTE